MIIYFDSFGMMNKRITIVLKKFLFYCYLYLFIDFYKKVMNKSYPMMV